MKRRDPKYSTKFQIGFDVWWTNKLLIEGFLKEGSKPWFCPSLKDFTDNSIRLPIQ